MLYTKRTGTWARVLEHPGPTEGLLERKKRIRGRIWLKNLISLQNRGKIFDLLNLRALFHPENIIKKHF